MWEKISLKIKLHRLYFWLRCNFFRRRYQHRGHWKGCDRPFGFFRSNADWSKNPNCRCTGSAQRWRQRRRQWLVASWTRHTKTWKILHPHRTDTANIMHISSTVTKNSSEICKVLACNFQTNAACYCISKGKSSDIHRTCANASQDGRWTV